MISEVMGVHYITSHKCWIARDIFKNKLYRGQSMKDAEQARKDYDKERKKPTRKSKARGIVGYNKKDKFRAIQPDWTLYAPRKYIPAINDGFWEQ